MLVSKSAFCRNLLLLFFCCCTYLFLAAPVKAAADPITIATHSAKVNFPDSIDFQGSAKDSSRPLIHATLYIKFNAETYSEQHDVDITPPGQQVTFQWHEDTSGKHYLPPGTLITYYWHLQDNVGNVHDDAPQSLTLTDTRFQWQDLTQNQVTVHWYSREQNFGQGIMDQVNRSLSHIHENLGGSLQQKIHVWVYANTGDFHSALAPRVHEWVGGIAFPTLHQTFIVASNVNDDTLIRDLPHELTHLVFHQITSENVNIPLWFDEGMAVYNQFYHEPEMTRRFENALSSHSLLRLDTIVLDFPANADTAYLAYAQSWNLIDYMYHTYGQAKMAQFIKSMNNPTNLFDDDLMQTFHIDEAHLENNWHVFLHQPPTLSDTQATKPSNTTAQPLPQPSVYDSSEPVLLLIGILLVVLPALGFGGFFVYRRRNQQRQQLGHQVDYIMNATFTPQQPLWGHYTDPHSYQSAPPPVAGPYPQQPIRLPAPPIQRPQPPMAGTRSLPNTPPISWDTTNRTGLSQHTTTPDAGSFSAHQEYMGGNPSHKQQPQE